MISVKLELWMGLGKALGENFKSSSNIRSVLETVVEDGATVGELFQDLADRYSPIREKVFNNNDFATYVVVTINERLISSGKLCDRVLKEGDKIIVLPMYLGG